MVVRHPHEKTDSRIYTGFDRALIDKAWVWDGGEGVERGFQQQGLLAGAITIGGGEVGAPVLRRLLRRTPPDVIGLKRRLAGRALEVGRYPFA